jgi:hypothetical protein
VVNAITPFAILLDEIPALLMLWFAAVRTMAEI